jgi:uncharacterized protein YjbJ (UPF0337 family)
MHSELTINASVSTMNNDEAKGRLKKAVGELTDNEKLKREGSIDKAAGKTKESIDKVKDALKGKDRP